MPSIPDYIISRGESGKKAYLAAKESDSHWLEAYPDYTPVLLDTKRYYILTTDIFSSKQEALVWLHDFLNSDYQSNYKFRKNTAGALILENDNYLFFPLKRGSL